MTDRTATLSTRSTPSAGTTSALADPDEPVVVLWSGHSRAEEQAVRARIRQMLLDCPDAVLSRVPAPHDPPGSVRAAVVTTRARAADDVRDASATPVGPGGPRPVALLLPGQGSQYGGMATGLYTHDAAFRADVDEVLDLWGPEGDRIRRDWLCAAHDTDPEIGPDDVRRAQPMLFAVDLALGRTLLRWGVRPAALLGHSAGEVVAATLAGVFTVAEAVGVVRDRVRTAVPIPSGGMLAVAASVEDLRPHLVGDVAIAAVNAGRQTMLAGPDAELARVARCLDDEGYTVRPVPATTPFHSPAMAPAVAAVTSTFTATPRAPQRVVWSGYTGARLTAADAASPAFWARQIQDTVYFGPALTALLETGDHLMVEAGPGQTLTAFARRQRAVRQGGSAVVPMLAGGAGTSPADERAGLLDVAARLWREGHDLAAGRI